MEVRAAPTAALGGRIVVSGGTPGERTVIAAWAERVARYVSDSCGPLPLRAAEALHIRLLEEGPEGPRAARFQGKTADGRFEQKLLCYGVERVDQEDLLEQLIALLLNRYRWHESGDAEASVADWLSVGMAQNMVPETRRRNLRMMRHCWMRGQPLPAAEVCSWRELPPGRCRGKARCGVFVGWVRRHTGGKVPLAELLSAAPDAGGPSAWEALWRSMGMKSAASAEQLWDLWLGGRSVLRDAPEEVDLLDIRQLADGLRVDEILLSQVSGEILEQSYSVGDLIDLRAEPWLQSLTAFMRMRLQSLAIGGSDDLRDVVRAYNRFLQLLQQGPGWWPGAAKRHERRLENLLEEARKRHSDLRRRAQSHPVAIWPPCRPD